uniref:Uncharacterized protein n=1 Tax=Cacopsylla melanoneura TaxID=428564 RepID=A0A8D8U0X7_9HEMI
MLKIHVPQSLHLLLQCCPDHTFPCSEGWLAHIGILFFSESTSEGWLRSISNLMVGSTITPFFFTRSIAMMSILLIDPSSASPLTSSYTSKSFINAFAIMLLKYIIHDVLHSSGFTGHSLTHPRVKSQVSLKSDDNKIIGVIQF